MLSVVTPFQVDLSRYYSPGEGSQMVLTLSTVCPRVKGLGLRVFAQS